MGKCEEVAESTILGGRRMYARMTAIPMVAFLLAADAPGDEAVQQEVKKLQGTWKVVGFEVAGKDQIAKGPKQIVIKGDELQGLAPNVKFRIDPSKKPRALDLIDKGDSKKVFPLIYELKDDELRIAFSLVRAGAGEAPKRPDSFQTKDKPLALITAKREKP
jgi:uncharacterized protein (TIGR03067 family)